MDANTIVNPYEHRYIELVNRVITTGEERETRAGPTVALFGEKLEVGEIHKYGFPVLTTRKMFPRGVWGELAAFIHGCEKLTDFKNFGCNYWDANAAAWSYNAGKPKERWEVGKIYGAQWRDFNGVDQLQQLVEGLRKDPRSRRHLLTTYNPAELHMACLPPCHLLTQFNVTNDHGLDCCVFMRSVDLCVGLPSDVLLYATLLELLCVELNLYPNKLTFLFGDTHVYKNHIELWHVQRTREPYDLPILSMTEPNLFTFDNMGIALQYYKHHDAIQYPFNA